MTIAASPQRYAPPPSTLAALEPLRATLEGAWLAMSAPYLLMHAPKGDGHPVLVLPGFMASDESTAAMRGFLEQLGYAVSPWEQGPNLWPHGDAERRTSRIVERLVDHHGKKVSLVGWSLGGVLARRIATTLPSAVRRVITLGSPFASSGRGGTNEHMTALHAIIAGGKMPSPARPPVSCTAIYSDTDGVAVPEVCTDEGPASDNVGVCGSHSGLGFNPMVLSVVADRLAIAEE